MITIFFRKMVSEFQMVRTVQESYSPRKEYLAIKIQEG